MQILRSRTDLLSEKLWRWNPAICVLMGLSRSSDACSSMRTTALEKQKCRPIGSVSKAVMRRTSLVAQWLRLHTSHAGGTGSIPGQGSKIPHAVWCKKKKKNTEQSGGHLTIGWMKEVRPREKRCRVLEGIEDK